MKKILTFILILICCFSVCACGKGSNDKYISLLTDEFNDTWVITGKIQSSLLDKGNTFEVILEGDIKRVTYFVNGEQSFYFGGCDLTKDYENKFAPKNVVNVINSGTNKEINVLSLINSLSNPEIKIKKKIGNYKVADVSCERYLITNKEQKINVLLCKELNLIMKIWDNNLTYFEITGFVVEVGDVSVND